MKIHKVLIDTNALIYSIQKKRDIFDDLQKFLGSFELIVLDKVLKELEKKAEKSSKEKKKKTKDPAKIALKLVNEKMTIVPVLEKKSTDDAIIEYAEKEKAWVFTNDRALKERLEQKKIKIIPPRIFMRKAK